MRITGRITDRQFEKLGWYDTAEPLWKKWNRHKYEGDIDNPMRPLAEALDRMGRYRDAAIQWKRAFRWDGDGDGRYDDDTLFEMKSAADVYEKAGLTDKAEAMRGGSGRSIRDGMMKWRNAGNIVK